MVVKTAVFHRTAAVASATAFTILIGGGQTYVSNNDGYTGQITGIWDSANGSARITEVTT